ncbi:MAG: translocation/assembly module TamB domain-containing protein [Terriglobales bacterium]
MNVSKLDVGPVAKAFAPSVPVTGVLNANLRLSGTESSPLGNGSLSLSNANVDGQPIQSLSANLNTSGRVLNATLNTKLPAGSINGKLAYNAQQQTFTANLRAPNMQLGQLAAVKAKGMDLKGALDLVLNGSGSIHNPDLNLTARIPTLQVNGQKISALSLSAALQNHLAKFDLASQIVNTPLRAQGTVQTTGDYLADVTVNTPPIPLAPLLAVYAPSLAGNVTGQTELHATLRGPLKYPKQVNAQVQIPQLSLNYRNTVHLAAAQPINIVYANGVARVDRTTITGTDTNLVFQGTIPVASNGAPQLTLLGTVNLALAQLLSPDITSSGQLRFNINSAGTTGNPNVEGQIRVINANFATGSMPIGLENGNGLLTLTRDRLNVTEFTGKIGGGTVTASGGIVYQPSVRFELALAGNDMRMLIPGGIRTTLNTNLALTGGMTSSALRGNVSIAQMQFTPGFDLMNFMGAMGGNAAPAVTTGVFMSGLKLNVGVQSTSGLNLVSRTLSAQGSVNLRVVGTADDPVMLGRIVINGGDLIIMGNRYVLQRGTVDLVNINRTEPVLNVEANTDISQYNIQIRMWGPAEHLHTSYTSVPALPPSDIINLIAFGKTAEAQAAAPAAPGNLGAESLVASQVSSQVTSRLEKIAGISQLTIDPELGGNGKQPGARIAIQQRVTGKIYVTFATDVTSTQDTVIRLEYHSSPRMTFSGTRDQNGGFGFETKMKKSW